jgi:hypothetical protein
LTEHEPREEDSAAAIGRALARAEGRAESARQGPPPSAPPQEQPAFDPALQERQYLERNLALQRAYAGHLAAALEEALAELPELRARAATLAAIERGRWWRLYLRLLPLLRFLRGAG